MAIIDDLPGVEVNILVNGSKATEYEDNDDFQHQTNTMPADRKAKMTSKYVECITDEYFSLNVSIQTRTKFRCAGLRFHLDIDGVAINYVTVRESSYQKQSWTYEIKGS